MYYLTHDGIPVFRTGETPYGLTAFGQPVFGLVVPIQVDTSVGTITLTGLLAAVTTGGSTTVNTEVGTITLTGLAASVGVNSPTAVSAGLGTITITGLSADVIIPSNVVVSSSTGTIVLQGLRAHLTGDSLPAIGGRGHGLNVVTSMRIGL